MERRHPLPFGAQLLGDGRARFRLWAPSARSVALQLEGGGRHPMPVGPGGWCEVTAPARAGDLYRYLIDDADLVPDPASRAQPYGVHGPSQVVDPAAFAWGDAAWRGRRWEEAVLYELHVGTFSPTGDFEGVTQRLAHLADLGVTALELMPVAASPGRRGWGYDGVHLFAPWATYGTPEALKRLVEQAHLRGMMVILDVVYNHLGPEGNYLGRHAASFFDPARPTPWGAGIDFHQGAVRDFFVHNALYWLHEYHLDGLRLDATEWMPHDVLAELAGRARASLAPGRHAHLILEHVALRAELLGERGFAAQWGDRVHHPLHSLVTGEGAGLLAKYADDPATRTAKALALGTPFETEEPDARELPRTAWVVYAENHDQVGNRALGDRVLQADPERARALQLILLLSPFVPMLFQGEEWGSTAPFAFFSDLQDDLREAVRQGRLAYFEGEETFEDPAVRARIPDPFADETFLACRLDWAAPATEAGRARLGFVQDVLRARREHLVPLLPDLGPGEVISADPAALAVRWSLARGGAWRLDANLTPAPGPAAVGQDGVVATTHPDPGPTAPPWYVVYRRLP